MEEIKAITSDMYKELKKALPKEAVKQHPTKTFLSTIKAIYVTERLNDVFGAGKWQIRTEKIDQNDKGMIVVKTTLTIPEYGVYYECFGGNDNGGENSKNFDLGDAYKGATTDGITKIGSYLGIGIEVFKGNGNVTPKSQEQKPTSTPQPQKPELLVDDTLKFTQAKEYVETHIKLGKTPKEVLELIKNKYAIPQKTQIALNL